MTDSSRDSILYDPALPSLPSVALEVLELASREDVDLRDFERAIERDQAISIRILRTVNSSYYGLGKPCGSIRQAISYLGVKTLKALVLGFSLERAVDGGDEDQLTFDFLSYWRRCFLSATAMRALATRTGYLEAEEAFIAGLVQDVGMIALWRVEGDRYLQVLDMCDGLQDRLVELERRHFEIDHASLAAELTRRWRFPESISDLTEHHHHAFPRLDERRPIRRMGRLAVAIVDVLERQDGDRAAAIGELSELSTEWFGFDRSDLLQVVQETVKEARDLARALNIDAGRMPSVESLLHRARRLLEELPGDDLPVPDRDDRERTLDEVTGLPDRSALLADLESCFHETVHDPNHMFGCDLSLLLVGVDEVRRINERVGDLAGDSAIAHVSECIRDAVKDQPGIFGAYRFVGAEIAVIVRYVDEESITRLGNSIRERIACTPIRIQARPDSSDFLVVKSTIGISVHRSKGDGGSTGSPAELLGAAMCAVTEGRRTGGDQVVMYRETDPDSSSRLAG